MGNSKGAVWSVLDKLSTLAILAVAGVLLWKLLVPGHPATQSPQLPKPPKEPISLSGAPTLGSQNAPLALIVFSDFQCPFCAQFAGDAWPKIRSVYVDTGRVLVAFRHMPLNIHPLAFKAAEAAACAQRKGKFWEMHDLAFASPTALDDTGLKKNAAILGLDPKEFASCLQGEEKATVQRDLAEAQTLGLGGTPTFFVGRVGEHGLVKVTALLYGARAFEDFAKVFDNR